MKLKQIKSLKNAGVWKNFSASSELQFSRRTLIFGFNGSGKTTLSRVFSSLQHGTIESKLPERTKFEIVTSSRQENTITERNISSQFNNSISVYNTDFISKNFLWDNGNIEGIIYLSEKSIAEKNNLEEIRKKITYISKEKDSLEESLIEVNKKISTFLKRVSKGVEELVPSSEHLTKYNEDSIRRIYISGDIDRLDTLSSEKLHSYQSILVEHESFFPIRSSLKLPFGLSTWLEDSNSLISQYVPPIHEPEFRDDPRVIEWVKIGIKHHRRHNSLNCFFCGNSYPYDRQIYLSNLPEIQVSEILDSLRSHEMRGQRYQEELENFIHTIPKVSEIVYSEREIYSRNKEVFINEVDKLRHNIGEQIRYIKAKSGNPFNDLSLSGSLHLVDIQSWFDKYAIIVDLLRTSIARHNNLISNIDNQRRDALSAIRSHVFASAKSEWDQLYFKYNYINQRRKELDADYLAIMTLEDELKRCLEDQHVGEDEMNQLLWRYLGHREIRLVAHEGGYNIRRDSGELATRLSEGERSAISFCYFLAELGSVRRDIRKLTVVIDDPVSSLDVIAQTHALSVMNELTESCAQIVLLTHSSSFASMVKRYWSRTRIHKSDKPTYLFLDCRISRKFGDRRTRLIDMPNLLKKYDSEYHYLFSTVYEAAVNRDSDQLFFLPNAIRKMLEIFTAFHYPDKGGFISILNEQKENLDNVSNYYALYSLMNIESHGKILGVSGPADLTLQDAVSAAEAAIEFVKNTNIDHFERMRSACAVEGKVGNRTKIDPTTAIGR